MYHPFSWPLFSLIICVSIKDDTVLCQYNCVEGNRNLSPVLDLINQISKELSPTARSQLLNALLKMTSQTSSFPTDVSSFLPCQDTSTTSTLNSLKQIPVNVHPIPYSGALPISSGLLPSLDTYSPFTGSTQYTYLSESNPQNLIPQTNQLVYVDNPFLSPSFPRTNQPQLDACDIYTSPDLADSLSQAPVSSISSSTSTPSSSSSLWTSSGNVEVIVSESQSNPFTTYSCDSESALPLNLEINIPPQKLQEPKVTIVSAAPPPPCPGRKTSNLKTLLELLILSMLFNDRNNEPCCKSVNNYIPIPYPIPVPIQTFYNTLGAVEDDDDDDD